MTRRIVLVGAVMLTLAWTAGPAWGHAGFEDPKKVPTDSDQTLTQSIPEERGPHLHNTKVVIVAPPEFAVKGCTEEGWTCTVEPDASGDGTRVTFTGTGARELFMYTVHTPVKAGDYSFKVSQTYSDGKVVVWDGPITSEKPASFLSVATGMMEMPKTTCSPDGTDLKVAARDIKYDKDCLAAPAGTPFTIDFTNNDSVAHDIFIHPHGQSDRVLFQGELFPGPKTVAYKVPALPAGTYMFMCSVHPSMFGKLVIGQASEQPKMDMGTMAHDAMGEMEPATSANRTASGAAVGTQPGAAAGTASAESLARTGSASRPLASGAGLAFVLGGLAVIAGARRRGQIPSTRRFR